MTKHALNSGDARFFLQVLEKSNSSIVITDGLQSDHPIIFVNAAFEHMTGYTAAEVLGRNCRFLQGTDRAQQHRHLLAESILKGEAGEFLLRNYRKDGSFFWNKLHLYPITGAASEVTHFVGIQHDVTADIDIRTTLEQQTEHLARLHEQSQVIHRELSEKHAQLTLAINESKRLSIQIVDTQEKERMHLARTLHDEFGQRLATLQLALHAMRPHFSGETPPPAWDMASDDMHWLIAQVRDISASLRPPALDYLPLDTAIKQMAERLFHHSGTSYTLKFEGFHSPLHDRIHVTVYRLVQECILNIVKHAKADRANIVISHISDDTGSKQSVHIAVEDDGRGFDVAGIPSIQQQQANSGLSMMRERIALLGGTLAIDSTVHRGTRIVAHLPLEPAVA